MAFAIGSVATTFAQTGAGNMMIGGSAEISNVFDRNFQFSAQPTIGFFVINNLAVGGDVSLGYVKPQNFDGSFSWNISPFVRYYFGENGNKIRPFGHLGFGYGDLGGGSNWTLTAAPGVAFFLNDHISLDLTLRYVTSKFETHQVGLFAGVQGFIGGNND